MSLTAIALIKFGILIVSLVVFMWLEDKFTRRKGGDKSLEDF